MSAGLNDRPYRLLMTTDAVGGVWRYAVDLSRMLSQLGVEVTLATLGPPASAEQRREAEGLALIDTGEPLDWLCDGRDDAARSASHLSNIALELRVDLIQLNGSALAGSVRFPAPVAAMHHSCLATWWAAVKESPPPRDWSWRIDLAREHLNAADSVAAPTRAYASAVATTYALSALPRVIYNGRPFPGAAHKDPPVAAVFTAGRLWDDGKNVATLDRAARRLNVPVLAAGPVNGPNGAHLQVSSIRTVSVLNEAEMRTRLAERPIFVSVARYEPFGLAVLEAAQAGCALILSDIPTFRELWSDAAVFVPADDDRALAEAATSLLNQQNTREALGASAAGRARAFTLDRCASNTLAWHREILSRRSQLGFTESAA